MYPGGRMMSSFVAWLRLGDELSIAHLRCRLQERPDQQGAITPPRNPIDGPRSSLPLGVFGPMNGITYGRTRTHHLASSRLKITAWNLQDNFVVFATDRSGEESLSMSSRFVALDEGPDITLDRAMIVVGRDP